MKLVSYGSIWRQIIPENFLTLCYVFVMYFTNCYALFDIFLEAVEE